MSDGWKKHQDAESEESRREALLPKVRRNETDRLQPVGRASARLLAKLGMTAPPETFVPASREVPLMGGDIQPQPTQAPWPPQKPASLSRTAFDPDAFIESLTQEQLVRLHRRMAAAVEAAEGERPSVSDSR